MLHHNLLLTYYYSSLPLSKGSKSGVWNQCILMLTSCILASYNEELQQKRRGYFFLQMVSKKHYCTWAAKTQNCFKTVPMFTFFPHSLLCVTSWIACCFAIYKYTCFASVSVYPKLCFSFVHLQLPLDIQYLCQSPPMHGSWLCQIMQSPEGHAWHGCTVGMGEWCSIAFLTPHFSYQSEWLWLP